MRKKALLVGIDRYPTSPLLGSVNDAASWSPVLSQCYGFHLDNIKMLLDERATTAGIFAGLHWLVDGARPGDTLFFHFSGHGKWAVNDLGGFNEILCPIDIDWRTKLVMDAHMQEIFSTLPDGVNLTVVFDRCRNRQADLSFFDGPLKVIPLQNNPVGDKAILLSSCRLNQVSHQIHENMLCGAFTHHLFATLDAFNYRVSHDVLMKVTAKRLRLAGISQEPELSCDEKFRERGFLQQF